MQLTMKIQPAAPTPDGWDAARRLGDRIWQLIDDIESRDHSDVSVPDFLQGVAHDLHTCYQDFLDAEGEHSQGFSFCQIELAEGRMVIAIIDAIHGTYRRAPDQN